MNAGQSLHWGSRGLDVVLTKIADNFYISANDKTYTQKETEEISRSPNEERGSEDYKMHKTNWLQEKHVQTVSSQNACVWIDDRKRKKTNGNDS